VTDAQNIVVVAGAGTGKTHALVTEYLFTLLGLDGSERGVVSPERVLAITFTDKSAAEMRRRVALRVSALARGATGDDEIERRARELGVALPAHGILERLHRHLAAAPIQTFHALAQSLLREHALDALVDPGFDLLDAVDERALLIEQTEAAVIDRLRAGDVETAELAARLKLRGFGAGRGLVDGVADVYEKLAERGLSPLELTLASEPDLAQALVESRRQTLRERVASLVARLEEDAATPSSRTRAASVAQAHAAVERALDAFRDPDDDETHVAAAFQRLREELKRNHSRAVEDARVDAHRAAAFLGAAVVDRSAAPLSASVRSLLVEVERKVRAEKDARGVLGFGDLLLRTRDLLRQDQAVRARVKARYERILVDEFQDTSPVQEDIVALIVEEPARNDRVLKGERAMGVLRLARGRLFVVGDPKQSIYGFRGADAQQFAHTEAQITDGSEALPATGVRRVLNTSRRSRAPLCALVNIVAQVTLESADGGPLADDEALVAMRGGEGAAGALFAVQNRGDTDLDDVEPLVVAREIQGLLDRGTPVGDDDTPCRPRDIAVLLRRVRPAAAIARALIRAGIPAQVTGGEGFFARPEVTDVVAALRLLIEEDDELAGLTVMRSAFIGLTDDAILALASADRASKQPFSLARALLVIDDADVAPSERRRLAHFADVLARERARVAIAPLGEIIDAIIDDTGYAVALGAEADAFERLANLSKLRMLAEGRPGDAVAVVARLWDFLDDPPREGVAQAGGADPDAVRIMTIHQAKGLEFPIVIVADAGVQLRRDSPDIVFAPTVGLGVTHRGRAIAHCVFDEITLDDARPAVDRAARVLADRDQKELSRLLYVALTRARDHVFVVGEERKSGAPSLRQLLDRTRSRRSRDLSSVFPIKRVGITPPEDRPLPAHLIPPIPLTVPERAETLLRREPSALLPDDAGHAAPSAWRVSRAARQRGQLTHAVFARVAESVVDSGRFETAHIDRLCRAALRGLGEDPLDDNARRASVLVRDTILRAIGPLVDEGYTLTFEEPLVSTLRIDGGAREVVLRGVADVVARRATDALVIDLKSSKGAAEHRATRLQLTAYALAVAREGARPLRVLPIVFGEAVDLERALVVDDALVTELHASLVASATQATGGVA
jgi:ATP-dependent helicase/nuclease subunit A